MLPAVAASSASSRSRVCHGDRSVYRPRSEASCEDVRQRATGGEKEQQALLFGQTEVTSRMGSLWDNSDSSD